MIYDLNEMHHDFFDATQSYSQETLDSKSRKDGIKQSYYLSIANRIPSQCHVTPEKKGAPIHIGKPTFCATIKGQRAKRDY